MLIHRRKQESFVFFLVCEADAILTLDKDDIVRSWNRGAEAIFGYQAEEIVGKLLALLVPSHLTISGEMEFILPIVGERQGVLS